jgi:hypothetical protein
VLLRYVFANFSGVDRLTYLDSDLYFFSDPGAVDQEEAGSAVTLTPHRFPSRLAFMRRSGEFNAGWVGVSATPEGQRFLEWWRARCIEWCRVVFEETRFGDQKYLDQVPGMFRNVASISHPGVNAAPWNIGGLQVGTSESGVRVDGGPLVAFHFHGLKRIVLRLYDSGFYTYETKLTRAVRKDIYGPYVQELSRQEARLAGLSEPIRRSLKPTSAASGGGGWKIRLRVLARLLASRTALLGP